MKSMIAGAGALAFMLVLGTVPLPAQTPWQQAWEILEAGTGEKSTEKRTQAVRVLGLLPGDPKALAIAEKALEDEKPEVKVAAAEALGQMGSPASIPKLKKTLGDKEPRVVLAAAHALRALNDPTAYEVYYEVLTGERKSGEGLIAEGRETLKDRKKMAELGFEEGIGFVPFAGLGFSAVMALRKDDSSPVRAAAAKILASDPDPRSGRVLLRHAATDKSWIVRTAALDAIAKRGDPQLLNGIVPAMSDENEAVRCTAAAAVIRLTTVAAPTARKKK